MTETGAQNVRRRALLRTVVAGGAGVVAGTGLTKGAEAAAYIPKTPTSAMAIARAGPWRPPPGHVDVTWAVNTTQKLVALTFDDGPMPNWTPMVHDILDEAKVPATFFLVGQRLERNARLIHGRMDRHVAANHTWAHKDLSKMTHQQAYQAMHRAHVSITRIVGKEPELMRPPYGHVGGTALSAAGLLGYHIVLWSLKMLEKTYQGDPERLVDYIADHTQPGTILLSHDTGNPDRLVAIRRLAEMIKRLRAEGYQFVTVPDLLKA